MIYKEEHRDLFSVPKDYALCHCVSSDFALGAGIAKEFAKRGVKRQLEFLYKTNTWDNTNPWANKGYMLVTYMKPYSAVFNLVTKERYWHKPTLITIRQALESVKEFTDRSLQTRKLAMPKIGCGLDKLEWEDVSEIIKDVFKDTDVEILVCIK